jgi:hypothetical protein
LNKLEGCCTVHFYLAGAFRQTSDKHLIAHCGHGTRRLVA